MKWLIQLARNPRTSLALNFAYAAGNCILGFTMHAWWFITLGAYYAVLAAARFCVLKIGSSNGNDPGTKAFARRITGILLVVLSFCLTGVNVLSIVLEKGMVLHEIIMITLAAYSFAKLTLAVIGMKRHNSSTIEETLRNLSLADACVSIYALQRAMLVSFPGMESSTIQLFNILTGTAVWLIVLFLGINLIGGKRITMAKSRITKANERIAEAVTGGYRKIEAGVVGGYKKIETGVVEGYSRVEDKFIDTFLTREGESAEEARARLKKETRE